MTVQEIYGYYMSKIDTTKQCLDFMIWCSENKERQQINGGYIKYAKKIGRTVDYSKGMPNQKWHLLESYCINNRKMTGNVGDFKCPELVIWLCEAALIEVTDEDIDIMKKYILDKGRKGRNEAGLYLWNKNKNEIIKKVKNYGA